MLVRPHDRTVEKHFLEVSVFAQRGKQRLPNTFIRPAREAPEHTVPRSESGGEVTPGRACSRHPEHRFNKQPVVCTGPTTIACFALQ